MSRIDAKLFPPPMFNGWLLQRMPRYNKIFTVHINHVKALDLDMLGYYKF